MAKYSEAFKEQVVRKMMPPNAKSVADVARETGVSEPTLCAWRNQYRQAGKAVPADPSNPENWSGQDKLAVVIETAAMNEQELFVYCRRKGLYPEQIQRWREAAMAANEQQPPLSREERRALQEERKRARRLEKELKRKEKALAEAAVLLVLQKKSPGTLGGARGRLIPKEKRKMAIELIEQAVRAGARQARACAVLDIDERTLRRWRQQLRERHSLDDGRKEAARSRTPANKLSEPERQQIVAVCNRPEYRSLPPTQIVPRLADEGVYLASERTFYRVLHEVNQVHRRGRAEAAKTVVKPKGYKATGPNQVWSWDITYRVPGVRGQQGS